MEDVFSNNWNIALSLSYNLSSLYQNKHKIHEVKQIVNIQKNKEEQIRQDIRINVKSAWIRHHEALDRVQALILSVRQAEDGRVKQCRVGFQEECFIQSEQDVKLLGDDCDIIVCFAAGQLVVGELQFTTQLVVSGDDTFFLEVTQPVYRGGKIHYNIKRASLEKQIAALNSASSKAEVKLLLLRQYMDLFSLYKQKDVFARNVEESTRRLEDIRRLKMFFSCRLRRLPACGRLADADCFPYPGGRVRRG